MHIRAWILAALLLPTAAFAGQAAIVPPIADPTVGLINSDLGTAEDRKSPGQAVAAMTTKAIMQQKAKIAARETGDILTDLYVSFFGKSGGKAHGYGFGIVDYGKGHVVTSVADGQPVVLDPIHIYGVRTPKGQYLFDLPTSPNPYAKPHSRQLDQLKEVD